MPSINVDVSNRKLTEDLAGALADRKGAITQKMASGGQALTSAERDELRDALRDMFNTSQSDSGHRSKLVGSIAAKIASGDADTLTAVEQKHLKDALADQHGVLTAKIVAKENFYDASYRKY